MSGTVSRYLKSIKLVYFHLGHMNQKLQLILAPNIITQWLSIKDPMILWTNRRTVPGNKKPWPRLGAQSNQPRNRWKVRPFRPHTELASTVETAIVTLENSGTKLKKCLPTPTLFISLQAWIWPIRFPYWANTINRQKFHGLLLIAVSFGTKLCWKN